jgi:hypothetical protein
VQGARVFPGLLDDHIVKVQKPDPSSKQYELLTGNQTILVDQLNMVDPVIER